MDCGYSLEPPRRGGSNEYPQSMFLSRKEKNKKMLLRARRNEKEMKVKPATSFNLLTIFIHKKNKTRFKTEECK